MSVQNDKSLKQRHKKIGMLIIGFMWIALGLFGLIFDPSKTIIIAAQLIVGAGILVFYFLKKLS